MSRPSFYSCWAPRVFIQWRHDLQEPTSLSVEESLNLFLWKSAFDSKIQVFPFKFCVELAFSSSQSRCGFLVTALVSMQVWWNGNCKCSACCPSVSITTYKMKLTITWTFRKLMRLGVKYFLVFLLYFTNRDVEINFIKKGTDLIIPMCCEKLRDSRFLLGLLQSAQNSSRTSLFLRLLCTLCSFISIFLFHLSVSARHQLCLL